MRVPESVKYWRDSPVLPRETFDMSKFQSRNLEECCVRFLRVSQKGGEQGLTGTSVCKSARSVADVLGDWVFGAQTFYMDFLLCLREKDGLQHTLANNSYVATRAH